MEDFLVFRCSLENQRKLMYLMLGLDCSIGIIDAFFFLVFGYTATNGMEGFIYVLQFHIEAKLNDLFKSRPDYNTGNPFFEKTWPNGVEMFWDPEGKTFEGDERCCATILRGQHWSIDIFESVDGRLTIATERGRRLERRVFFKSDTAGFGQFDATLDAHLKLLFSQ